MSSIRILLVTYYNFSGLRTGAINRVLALARVLSEYSCVEIIHRGADMLLNNIRFRGFGTLGNNTTLDDLLNALSPYMSYIYPSLYATLKEALRNVDIVQVEQPFLFVPTLKVMKILGKRPIIILDEHNVEFMTIRSKMKYLSANSLLTALSLPYVFLTEKIATRKANLVLCVSEADKKLSLIHI